MNLQNTVLLFGILLITACTAKGTSSLTKVYPVQWFPVSLMAQWGEKTPIYDQEDIQALLDKPWEYPFKLINFQTQEVFSADRCSQILPDIRQIGTDLPYESRPYLYQTAMCVAAESIAKARPAQYSALSDFKLDADFPHQAPKNMALMISLSETERVLQDDAIVSWAQAEAVKFVSKEGEYQAKYAMEGASQEISLIARGDFNHDNIEDLLLYAQAHVVGGTYTAFRLFWVTKIDVNNPITLVREYSRAY